MTTDEELEHHQQQIDLLSRLIAKHDVHIEALDRMTKRLAERDDSHEERYAALDRRLEALAASADVHDTELKVLIAVAAKHEARLDALVEAGKGHEVRIRATEKLVQQNREDIAALTQAIANLEKQWQAYLNTLPRQ